METKEVATFSGCALIVALGIICTNVFLGCYATEYVFGFLVGHHPVAIICLVIGLFFGEFTVPAAVFAYFMQFFGCAHPLFR